MKRYIRADRSYTLYSDSVIINDKSIGVPISFIGENKFRGNIYLPLSQIGFTQFGNMVSFTVPDWLLKAKELDTKYKIMS